MAINTKKVTGRREVHYDSLDDFLQDARRVSTSEVRPLGNWSAGQILEHLARSMNMSIDGMDFAMPAPARWLMSLLMKKRFLTKPIPPGFKSTAPFIPEEIAVEEALQNVEQAVQRLKSEPKRAMHPGFGHIPREEWDAFHLRHAEMHMSFLV